MSSLISMRPFILRLSAQAVGKKTTRLYQTTAHDIAKARAYCKIQLRKSDNDAHIISHFIPPNSLDLYLALRTLNSELIRLPDTTSNHTIGAMRFQFWRDSVDKTFSGNPPKQPICELISSSLSRPQASPASLKFWISRFLDARERGLENRPFTTLAAVEDVAEHTYSAMMYSTLAARPVFSMQVEHLASHIGKAQGIVALLRGIPVLASPHALEPIQTPKGPQPSGRQQHLLLPLDIMAESGVKEEDVFRKGPNAEGFRDAVYKVATRANDHLITTREMLKSLRAGKEAGHDFEHAGEVGYVDQNAAMGMGGGQDVVKEIERGFQVLLEAVPAQAYLENLEKADFDPWKAGASWKVPWRVWRAVSKSTI